MIRLSALGDLCMTLPLVRALRQQRPRAELHLATQDELLPLVEGHPDLDRVVPIPVGRIRRQLRNPLTWPRALGELSALRERLIRGRYDLVLDPHGNTKSGLVAWWTGAPVRVGPSLAESRELSALLLNQRAPRPPSTRRHRRERALSLLPVLGLDPRDQGARLPEYPREWARGVLPEGARRILLHPGASPKAAFKRWPAKHFGTLARILTKEGRGQVLVVGGPGEEELVSRVVAASEGFARALPTPPGLPELGGLLGEVDLFVGADSGPGNLASLTGTPTVLLYGPKDPTLYGPRGRGVAVRRVLECSPCGKRSCPLPEVLCMQGLAARTVADACALVLEPGGIRGLPAAGRVKVVLQE